MKIAIVDDEKGSRNLVKEMLLKINFENLEILEFDSVKTASLGLNKYQVDVILLDVNLGDGNAFNLLDNLNNSNLKVIFITAYEEFAIKAFKYSAIDYLLKPLDFNDFNNSLKKIIQKSISPIQITTLKNNYNNKINDLIIIPSQDGFEVVKINDIIKIDASGSYSIIYLKNNKPKVVSKNLKHYEKILPPDIFYRVHHNCLVNVIYIKQYHNGIGGKLDLDENLKQSVSVRKKNDFIKFLKNYINKI